MSFIIAKGKTKALSQGGYKKCVGEMTEVAGYQLVRSLPLASDIFLSLKDIQKQGMSYFSVFKSFKGELEIKL